MESAFRDHIPNGTRLIETFAWVPDASIARLELHLRRLSKSARSFGYRYDPAAVGAAINALEADHPLRCRLTLDADGEVEITTAPLPRSSDHWVLKLSPTRLSSADPFLPHKSTQRAIYDQTRANMPEGADEVIFLNERRELCEGTITNILLRVGANWLTPPVSSGCLPGVFRQSLLEAGQVKESVLTLADLSSADEIAVCNTLRGQIAATVRFE